LTIYPDKYVGIVESEKSAIIASCIVPDIIWLAAGNLNGLSIEKCQALKDRNVILYPDLGAFAKWNEKAQILNSLSPSPHGEGSGVRYKISISTLLEDESTDTDRTSGLDIADFIIAEFKSKKNTQEIQSFFSPCLQSLIEKNKTLLILINGLQFVEV
jgi:type I restriction enzyme R subunit